MSDSDDVHDEARLAFLRDEGLRVLAAYRQIPDAGIRQSILGLIEKVAKDPSTDPFGVRDFRSGTKP